MKKKGLFVFFVFFCCSSAFQYHTFKEPETEAGMLVVGRIIVEDNLFSGRYDVITAGIEVAIYGKAETGEQLGLWAMTDKEGYFALANVPRGEYALKGFRVTLSDGQRVIITNPLMGFAREYRFNASESILFEGEYFPFAPLGRVVSLKHNLFRLNPTLSMFALEWNSLYELNAMKLVDGRVVTAKPVEVYFMEKNPDTAWKEHLLASSKVNQAMR
jgi:hypothetical protein